MKEPKNKVTPVSVTTKRGKQNGYKSIKLWAKRKKRVDEAFTRLAKHETLTTQQKIDKAVKRGGSVNELERLIKIRQQETVAATEAKKTAKKTVVSPKK
jgi:hypothetical protein